MDLKSFHLALLALAPTLGTAQVDVFEMLEYGPEKVGYADTILFEPAIQIEEPNYRGDSPLFVSIWFPTQTEGEELSFGELEDNLPDGLNELYDEYKSQRDSYFIDYNIREEVKNYESIVYGEATPQDVFNAISETKVYAHRSQLGSQIPGPTIIYHHGSQGSPMENVAMAAYFASHGFTFIASNFEWPHDGQPYGLTEGVRNDPAIVNYLISFSKSLNPDKPLFYIGHSWGAQEGWMYLHDRDDVAGFVSLETTIEYKDDHDIIQEYWPHVYEDLVTNPKAYHMPILVMAGAEKDESFAFFSKTSNRVISASTKSYFTHESYTSALLLRAKYHNVFPQPDYLLMKNQIDLYICHIELIHDFLNQIIGGEEIELKHDKFFIHQ